MVLLLIAGAATLVGMWASFTASLKKQTDTAVAEAEKAKQQEAKATKLQKQLEDEVEKVSKREEEALNAWSNADRERKEALNQRDHVTKLAGTCADSVKNLASTLVNEKSSRATNPPSVLLKMACVYADLGGQVRANEAGLEPEQVDKLARAFEDGAVALLVGADRLEGQPLLAREDNRLAFREALKGPLRGIRDRPELADMIRRSQ
jgi:hypothetical protein